MPRTARTPGEIEIEKKKIICVAMELLYKNGFNNLSMKKIGTRLGMTAANLYNYFSSKDELYIEMRRYGLLELYDRLDAAVRKGKYPEERIRNFIREFVRFGFEEAHAYEILFLMKGPPPSYYKNTKMEAVANRETESSIRIFDLILRCTREFAEAGNRVLFDESTTVIVFWSYLHGAISLHNNKKLMSILTEVPSKKMETTVNFVFLLLFEILQNPALADMEFEETSSGLVRHPASG